MKKEFEDCIIIENLYNSRREHTNLNQNEISSIAKKLVYDIVYARWGYTDSDLIWTVGKYGKPYFKGHSELFFNISHSAQIISVAVSGYRIGVDVEVVREANLKISQRYFAINEQKYISQALSKKEMNERFYEVWTKKEAYIKWKGEGLHMPLLLFDVFSHDLLSMIRTWKNDQYIVSVCCENSMEDHNIVMIY